MRITRITIRNFRSIKSFDAELLPLTVLIGSNNCGKSNILCALKCFFEPSYKLEPFEVFLQMENPNDEVLIQVTFSELNEQDKTTFKQYVMPDETITIRKRFQIAAADDGSLSIEDPIYGGLCKVNTIEALRPSRASDYTSKAKVDELAKVGIDLTPYLPQGGRLTRELIVEAQTKYIEANQQSMSYIDDWHEPFMGEKRIATGLLGEFLLVPAVKDLSEETRIVNTTIYGKLMGRALDGIVESYPEFSELKNGLEDLVSKFNPENSAQRPSQLINLENSIKDKLSDWDVSEVNIRVSPPSIDQLFKMGTSLEVNDGVCTSPSAKGHGLQRALIFAITRVWAELRKAEYENSNTQLRARAASGLFIYAIEEPELYLHPHAQRSMYRSLQQLAEDPNTQVILSTHSSFFLDIEAYKSILALRKNTVSDGTIPFQVTTDIWGGDPQNAVSLKASFKAAYWFNPERSELFFAKRIVLVEGQTERVCLRYLAEEILNYDVTNISWVDCGGKGNIPLYMDVLNAFQLPYVVVHDEDPITETDTQSDKYAAQKSIFSLNDVICLKKGANAVFVLSPDFEGVIGCSHSQCDKLGKALANFLHLKERVTQIPSALQSILDKIALP